MTAKLEKAQPIQLTVENFSHESNYLKAMVTTLEPRLATSAAGEMEAFAVLGSPGTGDVLAYVDLIMRADAEPEMRLTVAEEATPFESGRSYYW